MCHNRMTAVIVRGCAVPPGQRYPMQRHNHDLRNKQLAAVRAKLGEGLRAQHDLMEPLAPRFVELLQELDASAVDRETTRARLYPDLELGVAAMVQSAPRKPGEWALRRLARRRDD